MNTRFFSLVFLMSCISLCAQVSPEGMKLPTVVPVSPEAAALGKYGEVPINLASGKINYQIPIYTIKTKGFEWPIYLSYNYNGLKISDDAPMTGLGWDLIANGRVTRQVRGEPDEMSVGDFKTNRVKPYLDGTLTDSYNNGQITSEEYKDEKYYIYDKILNAHWDAQQDMYHISAGTVSGTFMYTFEDVLFFTNHKNYVVEKIPDENGGLANLHFAVTDDKGIKYYFQTHELGEYKISRSSGLVDVEARVPISYLLTKIELPNEAGEIIFEYESSQINNESYRKTHAEGNGSTNASVDSYSTEQYLITVNRPLKKIIFPEGEVRFTTSKYSSTIGSGKTHFNYALDDISVWHNSNRILRYDFSYDNASKNRKILNNITKTGTQEVLNWYSFDYHTSSYISDQIDYTARDDWGYYNGISSVSSLLQTDKPINFEHTKKGALRTIHYPTGGTTVINYEQNEMPRVSSSSACSTYRHNKTIEKLYEVNHPTQYTSIAIDEIINVPANQKIRVEIDSELIGGPSGLSINLFIDTTGQSSECSDLIDIQVTNIGWSGPGEFNDTQEQFGYTENGQIHIAGSLSATSGTHAFCTVKIYFEDKTIPNEPVGGIRVASTTDYDNLGNSYTTNYTYTDENGLSTGKLTDNNNLPKEHTVYGSPANHTIGERVITTASSSDSFIGYQGSPVLYTKVETIKENGLAGKQREYFSYSDYYNNAEIHYYSSISDAHSFPYVQDPFSTWEDGRLWKKIIKNKTNTGFKLQDSIINSYEDIWTYGPYFSQLPIKAYGLAVGRNSWTWINTNGIPQTGWSLIEGDPDDYKDTKYVNSSKDDRLIKQIRAVYKDNYPTLEEETTYEHDSPYGQVTFSETTTSTNKKITNKYYYPYDETSPIASSLVSQNRIATPIETKTYQKKGTNPEELLSTQRTNYKDWDIDLGLPTDTDILLPENIQASKGTNTLENRIQYNDYYANGNVKEVRKTDGTPIVYIWGYNEQYPIAKIENATFTSGKSNTITGSQQTLINNAVSATINETTVGTENTLRTKLQLLRDGFPNMMVSTYTYDPLIGVTSMTDANGYTIYYEYDDFNRLKQVKDAAGKLLSENKYHYKGQQ